jgi:hypothetical protein
MAGQTSINNNARVADFGPGNYRSKVANSTKTASFTVDPLGDETTYVLDAAAGLTVTLPAATGSGAHYSFHVKTTITSNNYTFTPAGTDAYVGYSHAAATDASGATKGFATSAATTINLNGTTKMGIAGDYVELRDIGLGLWAVRILGTATGTLATPFA